MANTTKTLQIHIKIFGGFFCRHAYLLFYCLVPTPWLNNEIKTYLDYLFLIIIESKI